MTKDTSTAETIKTNPVDTSRLAIFADKAPVPKPHENIDHCTAVSCEESKGHKIG